jgi:hypothetical protein
VTSNVKRTVEFDALVAQHKLTKTDREKAGLEARLWDLATWRERIRAERKHWLAYLLGRSGNGDTIESYELREKLRDAPAVLWDHVESKSLSLYDANRLFDRCKVIQEKGNVPFERAWQTVTTEPSPDEGAPIAWSPAGRVPEAPAEDALAGEIPAGEVPVENVEAGLDSVRESARDPEAEASMPCRESSVSSGLPYPPLPPSLLPAGTAGLPLSLLPPSPSEASTLPLPPHPPVLRTVSSPCSPLREPSPVPEILSIDELVRRHKQSLTDREKSQIEASLWAALSQEERRGHHARERQMQRLLNGGSNPSHDSMYVYQTRAFLSMAPAELWDCVEKSLFSLGTAMRLYQQCQIIQRRDKIAFADALREALKQMPSRRNGVARPVTSNGLQLDGWDALWEAANAFGQSRMERLSDAIKREMCGELRNQIRDVLCTFIAKVKRKSAEEGEVSLIILHQRMARACEVLQIDVPSLGKPADLKAAVNRKRAIARFNHPDVNGSGDSDVYQRAIQAYDDIQAYNEFIEQKN